MGYVKGKKGRLFKQNQENPRNCLGSNLYDL